MDLRTFSAVLFVYRSNFHVLHFCASGVEFHTQHDKAAEYYEQLLEDADAITEMAMRNGQRPVNYIEAFEILKSSDKEFLVVPSENDFTMEDFVHNTDTMFKDILACLEDLMESAEIQDIKNAGVKSELETMHNYYDLQARYINVRRGM